MKHLGFRAIDLPNNILHYSELVSNQHEMEPKQLRPNDWLGRSLQEDRKSYREIALRAKRDITQKRRFYLLLRLIKSKSGFGAKRPKNKNIYTRENPSSQKQFEHLSPSATTTSISFPSWEIHNVRYRLFWRNISLTV